MGGVNLDEAIRLDAPLTPGEAAIGRSLGPRPGGGAAIAAAALAQAGHRVAVAGVVGDDPHGAMLRAVLAGLGVDVAALQVRPGPTTRALVLIEPSGERTIIGIGGYRAEELDGTALMGGSFAAVLAKLHAPDVPKIMAAHWAKGALTVAVLPRRGRQPLAARVLIASEADLAAEERADPLRFGRAMCGEALRWVVVTRGARGAEAFGTAGEHLIAPAEPVAAVDATGAGDVFAAGLVDALVRGEAMAAALARGTAWAARHVAHEGSLPPPDLARPAPP